MSVSVLAALAALLPTRFLVLDHEGRVVVAARAAADLAERSPHEIHGRSAEALAALFVDPGLVQSAIRRAAAGHAQVLDTALASRSGDVLSVVRIRLEPFFAEDSSHVLLRFDLPGDPGTGLESAKRIAGEVKHDINNGLMGLLGHLELLAEFPGVSGEPRQRVDKIAADVRRIAESAQRLDGIRKLGLP